MVSLYDKIMKIYPNLNMSDFMYYILLRDDGDSEYIFKWDHPDYPRPTDEQLAGAE